MTESQEAHTYRTLSQRPISRRGLLAGGGIAMGSAFGLAACRADEPSPQGAGGSSQPGAAFTMPTFRPSETVVADLEGSSDLMPAFLSYPAEPPRTVSDPPLAAGTAVSVFGTQGAPAVPLSNNDLWQAVAADMGGAELDFIVAPNGEDQLQKLQTMLAGDDLTDIVQLNTIPQLPQVLEAKFADLTDHLAGDAVLDYPNLAALPTWAWEGCIYGGRIRTVPIVRGKLGAIPIARSDIFSQAGVSLDWSDGDSFRQACRDVTDPAANRWAMAQNLDRIWVRVVAQMQGGPNGWRVDDAGGFTHESETDEYAAALEIVMQMYTEDGVFHPETLTGGDPQAWFAAGNIVLQHSSYAVWGFLGRQYPDAEIASPRLPAWDGAGTAKNFVSTAPFQFSGIKIAEPSRVAELLRALNYWAAPVGSAEYMLRAYGLEGQHHDLDGTDPVLTQLGQAESPSPVSTVISPAPAIYIPKQADGATALYDLQGEVVPDGIVDPSVGLYSEVEVTRGATAEREMGDAVIDIVAGRRPLADWPAVLEKWRSDAGDEIRAAFEAANAER
ncbi:extracellular solute-binding protein [Ruania alba]|uniref:Putative aldouronate transport system substrate-binding protein n=1 Tax=Ruania alba TaxID=648782 RepID=A0A1H5M4Q2_9MICO|nr:extracellular solute-binding protein [Ruania alba]SEE83478.1 putative aldouronate transport system substrate-binding protein [Ruania alba]